MTYYKEHLQFEYQLVTMRSKQVEMCAAGPGTGFLCRLKNTQEQVLQQLEMLPSHLQNRLKSAPIFQPITYFNISR